MTSEYDDHRRPLLRALKFGWIGLLIVTVASLALWGGIRELPGIWGALLGAAIGGGFLLLTVLSVLITANSTPATTGAIVLGSWLLKIVVLLIIMYVLKDLQFYDRVAFVVTVALALVVVLAAEAWGVVTSKVTYVS
ncbi:hypothetical protein HW450_12265 [Corynebacterium hindlerae]|uniref:Uncharacterized protein n=1 Tax=Corynebacterium hindlerae TaxID=699041 RepID=A0A7G5FEP1_9CORY|nr:hypothetical protein [Corynebacterium hindlerae]QMV85082.1 hypothetical protein HW450_12265 [Corynebacterium hindlerae]QTH59023.1 hypothetical protein J5O04_09420 [Corynebacterium hindlerae]